MRDLGEAIKYLFIFLMIILPLGVWKFVDIIIWFYKHIKIGVE